MITRVARTAAATLSHTFVVGETPTDSTATVTVAIVDANGTSVASGNATAAGEGGTGTYTFVLPPQAALASLEASWTATIGGAVVVETDAVEVAGGFFWNLVEARASDTEFENTEKYPTNDMIRYRQEVEEECERITQRAFVSRYRRVVLDGSGTRDLLLPDGGPEYVAGILMPGVHTIRSVTVAPRIGEAAVALTADQLAALAVTRDGLLRRTDNNVWTEGNSNVVVEYEHGANQPPADLKAASILRLRSRANMLRSGVPDRAISFTLVEGGTYRLSTPGAERTGIPEVDGVYDRYSRGGGGSGANGSGGAPASRALNFDPQRWSLYHGGQR